MSALIALSDYALMPMCQLCSFIDPCLLQSHKVRVRVLSSGQSEAIDNDCISECVGNLEYESAAPAIAMATVIVVWLVDFLGSRYVGQTRNGFHNSSLIAICRLLVRIHTYQSVIETSALPFALPPSPWGRGKKMIYQPR